MGIAVILLIIVVILAVQNINREKRYMSQILREKGAALIKAFEAGAHTGMMGMMWGGDQVQRLIEETARQPDILYLAVTDQDGVVQAHNDRNRIGTQFLDGVTMKALHPETKEQWRLTDNADRQRVFELYRYFRPLSNAGIGMRERMASMMRRRGMMMGQGNEWWLRSKRSDSDLIIFVGLDVEPFEDARREDIRNTIIISAILLLLGVGGFLSVIYAQNYRLTRRSLQDTSAFADEVVTNLPVGLIATDRNGNIAFFNAAAEKITGIKFDDARGKGASEALPDHWCGLEDNLMQGQPILEQEMECSFSNRKTVPLSVSASRIVNEDGEFVGNIIILRDLGEVRRLQEEVRRKEKLAALGRLAGGVAHEIRNPLSSIKGLATYFGSKFAEESEDKESANVMVREVDRLNRVVSELLELARPSELKLKHADINELLAHSVRLVQQDAQAKNIEINLSTSDDVPLIQVDSDRLSQCLLNIYLNAIQAMGEGGILSVKSLLRKNGTVKVEIGDTGKGISPNDLKKVFDPYFTTKPSGTGLGLAIVHKIIEAHQGNIKVESTPGKGTVFSIVLPIRA
jgi:two-component system sensor histidine kinase HydH